MSARVAIIDSGGANLASLRSALGRLGAHSVVTADAETICAASHVILPGVGAAADAMTRLRRQRLDALIPTLTQPFLGICLGLQLLADYTEEDDVACLGILGGNVEKLPGSPSSPVPNIGWCPVAIRRPHPVLQGIGDGTHFYFVHSFALPSAQCSIADAMHAWPLTAVAAKENFLAAQFHPERSAAPGARFLGNFLALR